MDGGNLKPPQYIILELVEQRYPDMDEPYMFYWHDNKWHGPWGAMSRETLPKDGDTSKFAVYKILTAYNENDEKVLNPVMESKDEY